MLGRLRKLVSGGKDVRIVPHTAAEEPTALVVARRERAVGAKGWFDAKSWFGGAPRLGNLAWPRDAKGKPLYFLAQLDLSEIAAAGQGHTALPTAGALAFFVGGEKMGAIVYVKQIGITATPLPADLCTAADIGGDLLVDSSNRFGPATFPYWPVEFRSLSSPARVADTDDDALDRARKEQVAAIAQHYQRRAYNFSAAYEAKAAGLGEIPIFWLAAWMFAERVPQLRVQVARARALGLDYVEKSTARLAALEAGLPPPRGQGQFGDPAKDKVDSQRWLDIGRRKIADADRHAAQVDAYVAKVQAAAMGPSPYEEISRADADRLDDLFDETLSTALEDYSRFILPRSWRNYATDAIKLMAAGPDEAYARLPQAWRDLINSRYRLPAEYAHLMFGIGENIQDNEMFEKPDMRMVLQLTFDDMMYWSFGDNGAYQFWMPVNALRTADVSQARVTFEAH